MSKKVLFLPGDGIGPLVLSSAETILGLMTDSAEVIRGEIGHSAYEATGQYLPHETLDLLDECGQIVCGPTVPADTGKDPVESLKIQLGLFARCRLFRNLAPDLGYEGMNVTLWCCSNNISNEITEIPDLDGVTLNKYVKSESYNKMMNLALSDVEVRKLNNISCVTREDFFPLSSGMFTDTFESLFPSDVYNTRCLNVTDWMSHVVKDPCHDQCIICADLYSQPVSGVLAGLSGFDHICPTCYAGDRYALFKPCPVANPDVLSEGYANPTAALMSVSALLRNIGLREEGDAVLHAVSDAYRSGERTPDVGGKLTTEEFTQSVIRRLRYQMDAMKSSIFSPV